MKNSGLSDEAKKVRDEYFKDIIFDIQLSHFCEFSMKIKSSIVTFIIAVLISLFINDDVLVVLMLFIIEYYNLYCISFMLFYDDYDNGFSKFLSIVLRLFVTFIISMMLIYFITEHDVFYDMMYLSSRKFIFKAIVLFIGIATIPFLVRVKNYVYNYKTKFFLYRIFYTFAPIFLFIFYLFTIIGFEL